MSDCSFTQHDLNIHRSGHSAVWLVPHETAALSVQVLCKTMRQFTMLPYSKHHMYVCLAVTWHLHFLADGQNLLHDTAVKGGWMGVQNKKDDPGEKYLLLLLPGLELKTFRSWVHHSTSAPSPLPLILCLLQNSGQALQINSTTFSLRLSMAINIFHQCLVRSWPPTGTGRCTTTDCPVNTCFILASHLMQTGEL